MDEWMVVWKDDETMGKQTSINLNILGTIKNKNKRFEDGFFVYK